MPEQTPDDTENRHQRDGDFDPAARALFGWVSWKGAPALFFWGLMALSAALILADLAVNRHDYFHVAERFGFYAFYGFGAFAFVVLTGWPLGALLRRGEDYYGDHEGPEAGDPGERRGGDA